MRCIIFSGREFRSGSSRATNFSDRHVGTCFDSGRGGTEPDRRPPQSSLSSFHGSTWLSPCAARSRRMFLARMSRSGPLSSSRTQMLVVVAFKATTYKLQST